MEDVRSNPEQVSKKKKMKAKPIKVAAVSVLSQTRRINGPCL